MIYLYLFALVLGGVLLGASMILGGHAEGHAGELDASHGAGGVDGVADGLLVAFLSMRFWTFFLAFFGLTGVVLDGFGLVSSAILAALLSVAMGAFAGGTAVWVMRRMRSDEANSAATMQDYVGKTGRVLVGFGPGRTGKIRLEVRGSTIDLIAAPIEERAFAPQEEVIVVEMDGPRAKVAKLTADGSSKS